jgi:hypothetical protein
MTDDLWNDRADFVVEPSRKPVAKVAASGQAGALALVLVYVAKLCGLDLPAEVAASLVGLIMFAAGYIKKG